MKKIFRNLLSGYLLVIFILLIEFAALIVLQFYLDDIILFIIDKTNPSVDTALIIILVYLLCRLIIFFIAFFIFFRIVNKAEDPEFKIPWIIGMLLLPLFTSIVFLIFGNHGLRKKDKRIVKAYLDAITPHFEKSKKEEKQISKDLQQSVGAFRYLKNTTNLSVHTNNRVTYYKSGEEFFPAMYEDIKKAKEFIFMEFFIITDGKWWNLIKEELINKAKEGVEIRIVYDDMGCGGTISSKTPKILGKYGIKCYKFHPFRPILSGMYNNRDHRKIVVIDHQFGYTGGMNLADEYANEIKRFGYWKDTMVRIEGSGIDNLISIFLENYSLASGKATDFDKYLNHKYEEFDDDGFVMPFGDSPGDIDSALIGEQNYINILNYAKKRVDISTPYLIPTYGLIDAMRNAALRGVEVNLIVPGIPDKKLAYLLAKSNFRYLLDAGVNIYLYTPGFNHMKSAIADGELAFVGTINFDFRSLVHHFECGTILYKVKCMSQISDDFKEMISVSKKVDKNFKLRLIPRSICGLFKIISALF